MGLRKLTMGPLLGVILLILTIPVGAIDNDYPEIFSAVTVSAASAPEDIQEVAVPGTIEKVRVNLNLIGTTVEPVRSFNMSLRNGAVKHLVRRIDFEKDDEGAVSWYGRPDSGVGSVLLVASEGVIYGLLELEEGVYKIEPTDQAGTAWLYEVDFGHAVPSDFGGILPPIQPDSAENKFVSPTGGKTRVDLLILYTNGFASEYPGALLSAQIKYLVSVANLCYKNSKVKMKLRLVGKKKVKYTDEGSLNTPLTEMTQAKGAFKKVPGWRNSTGADLVSLLRVFKESNGNVAGLAWVMAALSNAFHPWAYSVVQVGKIEKGDYIYFATDQTLVHELGHNMGSNHNAGDSPSVYKYSLGHRFGPYMSVMSYSSEKRERTVSYFSNPKINYEGYATGTRKLNNAKSLNNVRATVAGWRAEVK